MLFFSKLKKKLFNSEIIHSPKTHLAVFFMTLFFICFTPHVAHAFWGDSIVKFILTVVLKATGLILSIAATLFEWVIVPENMKAVIDNAIIYETWRTVRDIFNVAFIMTLLYSAFATIFQVSTNYNYKKGLLQLVLMALLVNFSYPIARFFIDASNMLMYGLLNGLGSSPNYFMEIVSNSGLADMFGATGDADVSYLLLLVIFTFIFAITLLVIAVLLVIRTIMLAIYVIFSPIAFVGSIMPGTALAEAGKEWWKDFMKNCFSGPTIILMLFIAAKMLEAITLVGGEMRIIAIGHTSTTLTGDLITNCSFFVLPIIILWIGIIQAQKSGIAGASAVVGFGTRTIGAAGKKFSGFNWASLQVKDYIKERDARAEKARRKPGAWVGGKVNDAIDLALMPISSKAGKRISARKEEKRKKDMEEAAKDADDTKTIDDVAVDINAVFDATGTIDPARVNASTAGSARSFTKKSADDKKDFILSELSRGIIAGTSLENILGGVTPSMTGTRIEKALYDVLNNAAPDEKNVRAVSAYVNKKSAEVMKAFIKP